MSLVFMVPKDGVELNLVFKFSVDGFDYSIFVSSDTAMKGILFMPVLRSRVTSVFLSDRSKTQLNLLGPSTLRLQFSQLLRALELLHWNPLELHQPWT